MRKLVVSPDAAAAEVEGGAVILHMSTKRYYSLNRSGVAIWSLLEKGAAPEHIVDAIADRYEIPLQTARGAVGRLIEELRAESLLIESGA